MKRQRKKKRSEVPTIPENESAVRKVISEVTGGNYKALKTLEEARATEHAALIMEGDWGGQIYLAWPASLVKCSEQALKQLLADLDKIAWKCNEGEGANLYFEVRPVGSPVAGGMGGGTVGPTGWVHEEFRKLRLERPISEVIVGQRQRVRDPKE
jgi:hypothetical protein